MGEGGELGQSYIILGGGEGLQNCYITLYGLNPLMPEKYILDAGP